MKKISLFSLATLFAMMSFAQEAWLLVTDASELTVDDQVVVVAKDYNVALSTNQKNNNPSLQMTNYGDYGVGSCRSILLAGRVQRCQFLHIVCLRFFPACPSTRAKKVWLSERFYSFALYPQKSVGVGGYLSSGSFDHLEDVFVCLYCDGSAV